MAPERERETRRVGQRIVEEFGFFFAMVTVSIKYSDTRAEATEDEIKVCACVQMFDKTVSEWTHRFESWDRVDIGLPLNDDRGLQCVVAHAA
jgi:hypothetical protein